MWAEGSFTAEPQPAIALLDAVEDVLDTHPNWDKVEARVIGANTYHIWRCVGEEDEQESIPGNGFGQDFYVIFYTATAGTGSLFCGVSEGYDNGLAIRPAPNVNNVTPSVDFSYGNGVGYDISNASHVTKRSVATSTVFDYWIKVVNDGIFVQTRVGTSSESFYVGLFESLMEADPFPLILIDTQATSSATSTNNNAFWTRHPGNTQSSNYGFRAAHISFASWTIRVGQISTFGDAFHGQKVIGGRFMVITTGINSVNQLMENYGYFRGLFRHFLSFRAPNGATTGDTLTVDGDSYHYIGNNECWINKDAA